MIRKETWQKVDWTQLNRDIAKKLKTRTEVVSVMRSRYAPQTRYKVRFNKSVERYRKMDFDRPTKVLAAQIGCSPSYILILRRKYAPHTIARYHGADRWPSLFDWRKVDWHHQCDCDIAGALGCSRERVRQQRRKLAPETHSGSIRRTRRETEWASVNFLRSSSVIAAEMKVSDWIVSEMRRKLAPHTIGKFEGPVYDWSKVDWTKPKRVIAAELGCNVGTVRANWQRKNRALAAAGKTPSRAA